MLDGSIHTLCAASSPRSIVWDASCGASSQPLLGVCVHISLARAWRGTNISFSMGFSWRVRWALLRHIRALWLTRNSFYQTYPRRDCQARPSDVARLQPYRRWELLSHCRYLHTIGVDCTMDFRLSVLKIKFYLLVSVSLPKCELTAKRVIWCGTQTQRYIIDLVMGITLDVAHKRRRRWPLYGYMVSGIDWYEILLSQPFIHSRSLRFFGSLAANMRYLYRVYTWPSKYGFISASFSAWILWTPCIADLIYPAVYIMITKSKSMTKLAMHSPQL